MENETEYKCGQQDAATDITSGHPKLYWQTRGRWGELLTQWMLEKFGVIVEHISDITSSAQSAYRKGYNGSISRHVDERFGAGSFQSVLDEVEVYRRESYQRHFGSS